MRAGEEYDSDDNDAASMDSDEERDVVDYWIGVVTEECTVADVDTEIADVDPPTTVTSGTQYMIIRWLIHDVDVVLDGGARQFINEGRLPHVLTDRLPSIIPVKLGSLKKGAKKTVLSKEKNTKLMAVLEPGDLGASGWFEP